MILTPQNERIKSWSQDRLQKNEDPARWTQFSAESSYNDKRIYSQNLQ